MRAFFFIPLLVSIYASANAQEADVLQLDNAAPINQYLSWLVDPQGGYSITDLVTSQKHNWHHNALDPRLNFGQQTATLWLRVTLNNLDQTDRPLFLKIEYPHHDFLDIYFVKNQQLLKQYATGDKRVFASRPVASHDFIFPVPKAENVDVYLALKTQGVMQMRTYLIDAAELEKHQRKAYFIIGLYIGAALIMLVYNLFIYVTIRDQSYLYYLAYIASSVVLQLTFSGFAFQYIWPNHPEVNGFAVLLGATALTVSAIGFIIKFIGLSRATTPNDYTWLLLLAGSFVLVFLSNFVLGYSIALKASFVIVTLVVISAFYLGLKYWLRGVTAARYFALAWFTYLFFIAMYLLQTNQLIASNFFSDNAFSIGSLLELSLLSLAFADKLNEERELRVKAQDDLLDITIKMNEELDGQVRARTSELEALNSRLKELSVTDSLTQLKNRFYFDQVLRKEVRRCAREKLPFSVIMLDIDHFKQLNDTHGHLFGDFCLTQAARLIQTVIKRPSDTVARYGGEEFVVLLSNTTLDGAVYLAEKIREQFRETPIDDGTHRVFLTVSSGVACSPSHTHTESGMAIVDLADQCLYKAKQSGRDCVVAQNIA